MPVKRRRSSAAGSESAPKRTRIDVRDVANHDDERESDYEAINNASTPTDHLSRLSDELIVRILHFADIQGLITCQRVSNRINRLSGDNHIWKRLYYEKFIRRRALRVPGARERDEFVGTSRRANWLNENDGRRQEDEVNWKRRYKLRHNWANGSCELDEIRVGERGQDEASPLVRLVNGLCLTADTEGLRAWDLKTKSLVAAINLPDIPSSLAVDEQKAIRGGGDTDVAVGFENGAFATYRLGIAEENFKMPYAHPPSSNGRLSAIAYVHPYILNITEAQLLSLYTFDPKQPIFTEPPDLSESIELGKAVGPENEEQALAPRLLSSLRSQSAWPPLSLSLRSTSNSIIASIAYALPTFLSGWSVGLQELHLNIKGEITNSRLASAVEGFQPLIPSFPSSPPSSSPSRSHQDSPFLEKQTRPSFLSYSHPYLLASHLDNTLTLYLVHSNSEDLTIKKDTKLLGHTSAVHSAHVGGRGKAVSVSRRGNELRVWELEGGLGSASSRRRLDSRSVIVSPHKEKIAEPSSLALLSGSGRGARAVGVVNDVEAVKGWVGFDDEVVIVLKESGMGTRALMVYDFT